MEQFEIYPLFIAAYAYDLSHALVLARPMGSPPALMPPPIGRQIMASIIYSSVAAPPGP